MHSPNARYRGRIFLLIPLVGVLTTGCHDSDAPTGPTDYVAAFNVSSAAPIVNSLADDDSECTETKCTLRAAIDFADPGATITFAPELSGAIGLTEGQLSITNDLTITGPGADVLAVERQSSAEFRIFGVGASAGVTISGLAVRGGRINSGGGAGLRNLGTLRLLEMEISGNIHGSGVGAGGGISNRGSLTLERSIVADNGAIGSGGILNTGTMFVTNSTFSGNSAGAVAAGIGNDGDLVISHTTIFDNAATSAGGGIHNYLSGSLTLRNSVVAGNRAGTGANDISNVGEILETAYNLIESPTGHSIVATGDNGNLIGEDPLLGSLAENGGPTRTHALLEDSPAIDAIPFGVLGCGTEALADQRGVSRPQGGGCDIGAFELAEESEFDFGGFLPPLADDPEVVNVRRAGSAVPLEFSLGGDHGLDILAEDSPTSKSVACPDGAQESGDPEAAETSGRSSLSYDADSNTYTYVWKTERAWEGTCRELNLELSDGSAHTARFRFGK